MDQVVAQIICAEIDKATDILVHLRQRVWMLLDMEMKGKKTTVKIGEINEKLNDAIDQTLETHELINDYTTETAPENTTTVAKPKRVYQKKTKIETVTEATKKI
jgi:hypothetical protein